MQTVVEFDQYLTSAKAAGMTQDERDEVISFLAAKPQAGDVMVGTGGARKLRFAGKGKGKSGGYRVITYYGGDDIPVMLLDVYSKGDKINLTPAERNAVKTLLQNIADDFRRSR